MILGVFIFAFAILVMLVEGTRGGIKKSRIHEKYKPNHLSSVELKHFKLQYIVRNDTNVTLQSGDTLFFQDVEYSLEDLEPYSVLSPELFQDTEASSPLLQKIVNGTKITVVKDGNQIVHICFENEKGRLDLIPLQNNGNSSKPIYAAIGMEDYDVERLNSMKSFDNIRHSKTISYGDETMNQDDNVAHAKSMKCLSRQTIEVAIAHDASLCLEFGGDKRRTNSHIQAIVGLAASYYESSCIKLSLSYIDGTCDFSKDTYKNIATSKDILEEFTAEWRANKGSVRRDVAHLFSGSSFDSGVLGWAWKSTICSGANGYGANWISWSKNIALRASLFAHELAHNAGASHFGEGCSNWLMAPCGSGLSGFSEESQRAVTSYLNKQSCVSDEGTRSSSPIPQSSPVSPNTSPTLGDIRPQTPSSVNNRNPSPTPREPQLGYSPSFELRSHAISSYCMTFDEDVIMLNKCVGSQTQKWKYSRDLRYIQNVAEGRCLVPDTVDKASKRVRLTLGRCPNDSDQLYQWSFSGGKIRNQRAVSSGNNLVIEATRAIKRNDQEEFVVVVPTLSIVDVNRVDYQTWKPSQ